MKRYILDKKEALRGIEVKNRMIGYPDTKNFIVSIIGPRRAGKTFFMYGIIKERQLKDDEYVFVNFEDDEVRMMSREEKSRILPAHQELYGRAPEYIFLDEVQSLPDWQSFVYSLYEEKRYRIFISGSSSKMMSREVATQLRGRGLSVTVLPFSFREFLSLKGIDYSALTGKKDLSTREESIIKNLLSTYLREGGFPLVLLDGVGKRIFFSDYADVVVQRDIIERYGIRNSSVMKFVLKSAIGTFAREFSAHKLYRSLKSQGVKVSKNSIYAYASALEDVMFCFFVKKFSYSIRKQELSIPKIYLNDTGYSEAFLSDSEGLLGRLMENAAYLELKRREADGEISGISYWQAGGTEADFIIRSGFRTEKIIQVTRAESEKEVEERELRGLLKASEELKCNDLLCITWGFEGECSYGGKIIRFAPLWRWLIGSG